MTTLQSIRRFASDEEGVTAIEYGLIASLVALALIVGATALGLKLDAMFTYFSGLFKTA